VLLRVVEAAEFPRLAAEAAPPRAVEVAAILQAVEAELHRRAVEMAAKACLPVFPVHRKDDSFPCAVPLLTRDFSCLPP